MWCSAMYYSVEYYIQGLGTASGEREPRQEIGKYRDGGLVWDGPELKVDSNI